MSRALSDSWFLTGPTAAGKSSVGVELARRLGAEIVSMDSMALYRRLDIGTAKPTPQQREAVPHHLIDILQPEQEFSLAQYLEEARRCVDEIRSRGREVLFVGGTPLYLKGLLRGIFEGPAADWEFRRRLEAEAERHGSEHLHRRVAKCDPAAAARLHPNDTRRLIRALEVFEKTGCPISHWQQQFEVGRPAAECRVFVLDWPKTELHARIDRRVDAMFAAGLVEEVRRLLTSDPPELTAYSGIRLPSPPGTLRVPLPQAGEGTKEPAPVSSLSRTARQAVGYREVIEHLEGRRGLAATIDLVKQHTRQLAKRQGTWFRSLSECRFVPVREPMDATAVAESLCAAGQPV